MDAPKLADVEQVSDGWVKKYILTYEMPDGTTRCTGGQGKCITG